MNVWFLGTGGWIPGENETSSFLVEHQDQLFLLDAGTGVSNLRHYTHILDRYDTLHVLLSHYHLDHTVGLIYLSPYVRNKRLRIYGPGKMAYGKSAGTYLREEFFSRSIDRFSHDVECIDFPGPVFWIGPTKITVAQQKHSAPSFRIGLDDQLLYATDTAFEKDAWGSIHAQVLLHECREHGCSDSNRHASLQQLKQELPSEHFGRIFLIHHNPFWTEEDWAQIRADIAGTNIEIATDGVCLTL